MGNDESIGMHAGVKPELFRFAEKLISEMTGDEKILWGYLRLKPLGFKFRRQHPFSLYILDFYCHKAKLAIEIDGQYHLEKNQIELDEDRTNNIQNLGLHELRFTNHEVLCRLDLVIKSIEDHLNKEK